MVNVLADLAIGVRGGDRRRRCASRAPTTRRPRPSADAFKRLATAVAKYHVCKRAPGHAYEALECLGGNGYVEASGCRGCTARRRWPRSGRARATSWPSTSCARWPAAARRSSFFAEVDEAAGADRALDASRARRARALDLDAIEPRARRVVERMALCLQGSLLVRHAPPRWPTPSAPRAWRATRACTTARCPPARTRGDRRAAHAPPV
jgi:putative acyl-CoA dehydrogenase